MLTVTLESPAFFRSFRDQADDIAPDQRLAAGEPDLADAGFHRGPHHALDLLKGQDFLMRNEAHALPRHAVHAVQVTAVGYRHS
jgi:hypothetical protein